MALRGLLAALSLGWLLCLPWLTWQRVRVFQSDERLWTEAERMDPRLVRPHFNLGLITCADGRFQACEWELQTALALLPDAPLSEMRKVDWGLGISISLARLWVAEGRHAEADHLLRAVARAQPNLVTFLAPP